jgi:hypothetical protein
MATRDAFKLELNRATSESQGGGENEPNLKMAERHDWALFRNIDGLQQKAGVPAARLRRLVLKELADNALDAGSQIHTGFLEANTFFIEDDGPGLDGGPKEIASLFSIRRPMRSTKLLRLPQRGALGNGLRVVAGAVLASDGSLVVITRNLRSLIAQFDGCSGGKAREIVSAAKLDRATCENVNRHQAKALLEIACGAARKVNAERLG